MTTKSLITGVSAAALVAIVGYGLLRDRVREPSHESAGLMNGGTVGADAFAPVAEPVELPPGARPLDLGHDGIIYSMDYVQRVETGETLALATAVNWSSQHEVYYLEALLLLDERLEILRELPVTPWLEQQLASRGRHLLGISADDSIILIRTGTVAVPGPGGRTMNQRYNIMSMYSSEDGTVSDIATFPSSQGVRPVTRILADGRALLVTMEESEVPGPDTTLHDWDALHRRVSLRQRNVITSISLSTGESSDSPPLEVRVGPEHVPAVLATDGVFFSEEPLVVLAGGVLRRADLLPDFYLTVVNYEEGETVLLVPQALHIIHPAIDADDFLYVRPMPDRDDWQKQLVQYSTGDVILEGFGHLGIIAYHKALRRIYLTPDPMVGEGGGEEGRFSARSIWHYSTGRVPDDMPNLYYYDF